MRSNQLPDIEYLKERLYYDETTGKLYWKEHPSMPRMWNTRHSGKETFKTPHNKGYLQGKIDGVSYLSHRIVWSMHYNENVSQDFDIDHIDGNKRNNHISNLRLATRQENVWNAPLRVNNKSGRKGVSWCKFHKKWRAAIRIEGKQVALGYFDDIDAASNAYIERSIHIQGEFRHKDVI